MTDRKPLVGVGIPVYNGEAGIGRVLEELVRDEYRELEVNICDNASTDGTEAICRRFAESDSRIRYHRSETHTDSAVNFEKALSLSGGEYFLWASHHDLRVPGFISKCVEALESEPGAVLCFSKAKWIMEGGKTGGEVPRPFDTRGLPQGRRFHRTIWEIGYCYQV
jgi:glycosyltransferase involved in cell wall biosynthesis